MSYGSRGNRVSVTPLGGVNSVGNNCFLYRVGDYSVVVDCGTRPLTFEEIEILDRERRDPPPRLDILDEAIKESSTIGIITHAHLDHIGAVAELGKRRIPVFLSQSSKIFMEKYAKRCQIPCGSRFRTFHDIAQFNHGDFNNIVLIPLRHSIPGTYGVLMRAGGKNIFHLGDFKFNGLKETLEETKKTFREIRKLVGRIDCLVLDVLNADLPGFTPPEQQVLDSIEKILREARRKTLITMFSSNLQRIKGIIQIAESQGKTVGIMGQSMALSYDLLNKKGYPPPQSGDVVLISGSQGEKNSALARIISDKHQSLRRLSRRDTFIGAFRCIPGNEEGIRINLLGLHEKGVEIRLHYGETKKLHLPFKTEEAFLHSSGHEQMGGLKEVVEILEPGVIVPFHAPEDRVEIFENNINIGGTRIQRLLTGETLEI